MPQPDYVPLRVSDRVRLSERLPVPDEWRSDRPAEITSIFQPSGDQMGTPGPDQGYGIKLAKRFADRLKLADNEHLEDAMAGCLMVALKRAALFGRAPVIYDFELAYTLWGFLGDAPEELIIKRKAMFESTSHHYDSQRSIADAVPEATLRLSPAQVVDRIQNWKELLPSL